MPVSLQTLKLTPAMKSLRTKVGVAVDGNIREGDLNLASSTLLQDENSKDIFGMVISYTVKVKLFLGQCDLTFREQPTEQIFAKKLMQSNTVFPQIVFSLEQIPPLKLYEVFYIQQIQKKIVSVEAICGNMVSEIEVIKKGVFKILEKQ